MASIEYAIEIFTGTSVTSSSLAINNGVIRVITGRPDLTGAQWGPDEINSGSMTDTYYKGFLIKNGLSSPSRQIDISKTGNYGSLSSFTFKFDNSNLYWNLLNNQDINLINKQVRVYSVIDNIFYQIWSGNITQLIKSDAEFLFSCEDASAGIHKTLPKTIVNEKTLPVSLGNSEYVIAKNITDSGAIYFDNGNEYSPIKNIERGSVNLISGIYDLRTEYELDDTVDLTYNGTRYLYYKFGGDQFNYSNERLVYILNNVGGGEFVGNGYFKSEEYPVYYKKASNPNRYTYANMEYHETAWTVSGYSEGNIYVGFTDIEKTYSASDTNATLISDQIYVYDETLNRFNPIKGKLTDNGDGTYTVIIPNADPEGSLKTYSSLNYTIDSLDIMSAEKDGGDFTNPADWGYTTTGYDLGKLTDKDQTEHISLSIENGFILGQDPDDFILRFQITLTDDIADLENVFVLPDIMCRCLDASNNELTVSGYCTLVATPRTYSDNKIGYNDPEFETGIDYIFFDPENRNWGIPSTALENVSSGTWMLNWNVPTEFYDKTMLGNPQNPEGTPHFTDYNTSYIQALPYFYSSGSHNDYSEGWIEESFGLNDITKQYIEEINNTFDVYIRLHFEPGANIETTEIKLNQLLIAYDNSSKINEEIYVKASGVIYSGVSTDSVYGTFRYILESNDGIPSGNINYGNLETQRGPGTGWDVARQISQRNNSQTYLKELCEHSYVALYPDRKGYRTFNAWLDNLDDAEWNHDNNTIIKDTLSDMRRLPIKDVYNDFLVEYNYNIASEKYQNQMYVTKTNEASFPDSTGNWTDYVGGYSNYYGAQTLWNNAASGYLITNTVVTNPKNLQTLTWYNTEETAYNFLDNLIRWTSAQHSEISYSIPLTSGNIDIELTDKVNFKDKLLTNDTYYEGYVTNIKYDLNKDKIDIGLLIENEVYTPIKIIRIIETGSAGTQIHESGSLSTQYVETT